MRLAIGFCAAFLKASAFAAAAGVCSVANCVPGTPIGVSCATRGNANRITSKTAQGAVRSLLDDFIAALFPFHSLLPSVRFRFPAQVNQAALGFNAASEHSLLLFLWRRRFWNPQRPRAAEHERASLHASLGRILVVVFKEENEILFRQNVIGLNPDAVNGIVRNPAGGDRNARDQVISAVTRNLPLVVPNQAQLG